MIYFHNATKNDIWSSLINPKSQILMMVQLADSTWPMPPAQQGAITIRGESKQAPMQFVL